MPGRAACSVAFFPAAFVRRGEQFVEPPHLGGRQQRDAELIQPRGRADRPRRPGARVAGGQERGEDPWGELLAFLFRDAQDPGRELDHGEPVVVHVHAEARRRGHDHVAGLGEPGPRVLLSQHGAVHGTGAQR
ncbi:hypothetical protein [Carbonactinospora thermoautotrophica]|uniref:hypothetical protein n=1 Tax=Carbonactinospora thermoautotrophica TaxID=1469144 RepID=UPI003DA97A1D